MAATLGTKPLITKVTYEEAKKLLNKVDAKGVPFFVRVLEKKEGYLAAQIYEMASTLSSHYAKRINKIHGVTLSKNEKDCLSLDFLIMSWFHYLVLDKARDIEWEKTMKEIYDEEYRGNNKQ